MSTQSAPAARAALYTALQGIYAASVDSGGSPVLVSYGKPGTYQPDYIVAIIDTRRGVGRPTNGPRRSRRSPVEIDVVFSLFVPGAEVAQQTVSDACDGLISMLENYFRTAPNEALGGACWDAFVSNVDGPKPEVIASKSGGVSGRNAEATVTVSLNIDY